jgi:hypothetical protein
MYSNQDLRQSIDSTHTRDDSVSRKLLAGEQKITIDKRHYNKLLNFLKAASSVNLENKGILFKTQCEDVDTQTDFVVNTGHEVGVDQDNSEAFELLKFENKTHIENLKLLNDSKKDLLEEVNTLKTNSKRLEEIIEKFNGEINALKNDLNEKDRIINSQICEIEKLEKINKKNIILMNRVQQPDKVDEVSTVVVQTGHLLDDKVMLELII